MRRESSDADTYDWGDCFGWFFGNLRDDACQVGGVGVLAQPMTEQFSAGCFMFFSRDHLPAAVRIINPFYERDVDSYSDLEEFNDPIAMERY